MERKIAEGERGGESLIRTGIGVVETEPGVRLDYLGVVDPDTLLPVDFAGAGTLAAIAAYVGSTRLIDNFLVG